MESLKLLGVLLFFVLMHQGLSAQSTQPVTYPDRYFYQRDQFPKSSAEIIELGHEIQVAHAIDHLDSEDLSRVSQALEQLITLKRDKGVDLSKADQAISVLLRRKLPEGSKSIYSQARRVQTTQQQNYDHEKPEYWQKMYRARLKVRAELFEKKALTPEQEILLRESIQAYETSAQSGISDSKKEKMLKSLIIQAEGNAAIMPLMLEVLKDKKANVRVWAVVGLFTLGDQAKTHEAELLPVLRELMKVSLHSTRPDRLPEQLKHSGKWMADLLGTLLLDESIHYREKNLLMNLARGSRGVNPYFTESMLKLISMKNKHGGRMPHADGAQALLSKIGTPAIPGLILAAQSTETPGLRQRGRSKDKKLNLAHETISKMVQEDPPAIFPLIKEKDPWMRLQAVLAAGLMGEAGKAVIEKGLKDTDEEVKKAAIKCAMRMESLLPQAIKMMNDSAQPRSVRSRMIESIWYYSGNHPEVIPAMVEGLREVIIQKSQGKDIGILDYNYARNLGRCGFEALPYIMSMLKDSGYRSYAILALESMEELALPALPTLLMLMHDPHFEWNENLEQILANIGHPVIPHLKSAMAQEEDWLKIRAVRILRLYDEDGRVLTQELIACLKSDNEALKVATLKAWNRVHFENVAFLPYLVKMVKDKESNLRVEAIILLKEYEQRSIATPILLDLVHDDSEALELRQFALMQLIYFEQPRPMIIKAMKDLRHDLNPGIATVAKMALEKMNPSVKELAE